MSLCFVIGSSLASPIPIAISWEKLSEKNGIMLWKREIPASDVFAFRGDAVIDAPISKVITVLTDTNRKKEWVANLVSAQSVRQIGVMERIEYNHTSTPFPLRDRDFVFHAKAEFNLPAKQVLIRIQSVQDASVPEKQKLIRGQLHNSLYTLTSIENGKKTRVTVEILVDPMGSVPKWAVNLVQKSWPQKTLEGIQKQAAKLDVVEDLETKKIFDPLWNE